MKDGRYQWDPDGGLDGEGESVFIPQDVSDATDRLSTRAGAWDDFRLLLLDYYHSWFSAGKEAQRTERKEHDSEANRQAAEYGQGKAEFHTLDNGVFHDRVSIGRGDFYPRIWKRACRTKLDGQILTKSNMHLVHEPIKTRTYEMTHISDRGLPVYEEMQ